jgi:hypothetical protein
MAYVPIIDDQSFMSLLFYNASGCKEEMGKAVPRILQFVPPT